MLGFFALSIVQYLCSTSHLQQGLINYMHCAHIEIFGCTKLHALKSVKTPLSSTPMLFKVMIYFCV